MDIIEAEIPSDNESDDGLVDSDDEGSREPLNCDGSENCSISNEDDDG